MDTKQIKPKADLLFAELLIGGILFKRKGYITVDQISSSPLCSPYSKSYVANTLRELVVYGIATCKLQNKIELSYKLTEFGLYYYKEMCTTNTDIQQLLDRIGSEIK